MPRAASTAFFFVAAFAITSLALLAPVLAAVGVLAGEPTDYFAGAPIAIFGPTIAATWASAREGGRARVRALFSGLTAWRVRPRWYLLALSLPTLAYLPFRAAYELVPGVAPQPWLWLPGEPQYLIAAIMLPIGEEIGWRGYALPRLIARHGPVRASLRLGLLWALWHVPMLVSAGDSVSEMLIMLPYFLAGSILFTWLHQRTGGSLLLAVVLHVGAHLHNTSQAPHGDLVPLTLSTVGLVSLAAALLALDRGAWTPTVARAGAS